MHLAHIPETSFIKSTSVDDATNNFKLFVQLCSENALCHREQNFSNWFLQVFVRNFSIAINVKSFKNFIKLFFRRIVNAPVFQVEGDFLFSNGSLFSKGKIFVSVIYWLPLILYFLYELSVHLLRIKTCASLLKFGSTLVVLEVNIQTWVMSKIETILKVNAISHPLTKVRVIH